MKKSVCFAALLLLLSFISFTYAQNCNVKITSPENGSHVDGNGLVSGTVDLPPNGYLWLFSHKLGFNGWWPQGNGPAQIMGNQWDVLVYYGVKNDFGRFEVIAMVVDEQTHEDLKKWVTEAPGKDYPPISLPTTIDGCNFARIRVEKTRN